MKCKDCPYESKAGNVRRHHQTAHQHQVKCDECEVSLKNKKELLAHKREAHHTLSCLVCGLSFNRCDSLKVHMRTHQDKEITEKPKEDIITQVREFCCEHCGFKTKRSGNLRRHLNVKHNLIVKAKRTSRQKKYRQRLKFLKDVQNANFIKKMSASGDQALVDTDIEQIMAARPNMSNRDVIAFLRILKKKLPAKTFSTNVRKAVKKRTDLLDKYFETKRGTLVDKDGESVEMPITVVKDLNVLVKLVVDKREINEEKSKVVLGVDGGLGKLIVTASIIPEGEKEKRERAKEAKEKDRYKSTGVKRTMIIARVDEVPECYENLEILMTRLRLRRFSKQFSLVCDLKLIDILVGLQGGSSMYPCPYCLGCKVDSEGKPTNQKGKFQKGEPRTFRNIREQYEKSKNKHRNGKSTSRKSLKKFFSVKNLPMQVTDDMDEIPISKMYPPPSLHCGILGPANDTLKKLESIFPVQMSEYRKVRHIKGSGPGGDFNGPTLKSIMGNTNGKLDDIKKIVEENGRGGEFRFVEHLTNLNELNTAVNSKVLDLPKMRELVSTLVDNFRLMQDEFNLSQPLKLHIIQEHYIEHFELTGETLLKYSDEICEAIRSQYSIFDLKHKYVNNKKNSDTHLEMQHKSMVHFNSLNLGDV